MTTIAYKDGFVVADCQETLGGVAYKSAPKIVTTNQGMIVASAGQVDQVQLALEFFNRPDWKEKLNESPTFKKGYEAIIFPDGVPYYCYLNCVPVPLGNPFYAIGSGWQLAWSAMALGQSAEDAVKFAGRLNIHTSEEVQVVNVKATQTKTNQKRPRRTVG